MSLFKARDIWSFDLEELQRQSSDVDQAAVLTDGINSRAQFVAHIGQWSCIGSQDVFVCGDLRGNLYIIQVPESDQRKHIRSSQQERLESIRAKDCLRDEDRLDDTQKDPRDDISERQILAAYDLHAPLVDLKCGYFTSTLKQSIAALTLDKLLVLQVKRHQVDLLSAPNLGESTTAPETIDKNLLSHELEVHMKFDLIPGQLACQLLVIGSHAESSLVDAEAQSSPLSFQTDLDSSDWPRPAPAPGSQETKFKRTSKRIAQQLRLPQRDKIIVQYADQFLFTLVNDKKITGHFDLGPPGWSVNEKLREPGGEQNLSQQELKLRQMERAVGCMPMAYLVADGTSSLMLSYSDFRVHSLPLERLVKQAKENVMKRVALELLGGKGAPQGSLAVSLREEEQVGLATVSSPTDKLVRVDLDASSEWSRELLAPPIAMQGLTRQIKATAAGAGATSRQSSSSSSSSIRGQLLVMSRYSLDLFSHSGAHLWSQRFETPLMCMHSYTISDGESDLASNTPTADESGGSKLSNSTVTEQYADKIVTLLCSDTLSDDKSNLTIMSDDQISWSALVNSKPLAVWRLNLKHMHGLLATLDLAAGQLLVSYLGTNSDSEVVLEAGVGYDDAKHLVELERLDETLVGAGADKPDPARARDDLRPRLRVLNRLEADPIKGSVGVRTSIKLHPSSEGVVIHNLVVTFEYDDLLRFQWEGPADVRQPARGVAQVRLGSYWPDRREPIKLDTTLSLLSSTANRAVGVAAIDSLGEIGDTRNLDVRLLPKTLKVVQHFDFNETHSEPLHEEQTFMLPVSMIAQLAHIDYSSGQSQELDDVLNNLAQYKRDDGRTPSLYCDLFLQLKCDFMTLLGELVDHDFMCQDRGMRTFASEPEEDLGALRKAQTLENINRLAQSLEWRLALAAANSGTLAKQSSEELAQPIMLSIALRLRPNKMASFLEPSTLDKSEEQTVWVHLCDLSQGGQSNIVEDFIKRHMRDWKEFKGDCEASKTGVTPDGSQALISIECDQPLPILMILDHLLERMKHLTVSDTRLDTRAIRVIPGASQKSFDHLSGGNRVGVSAKLHKALVALNSAYNTNYKDQCKQLESELVREYCKFQVVTKTSLSLAKRLPSLPDDMSDQVTCLMSLVRHYHQKLSSILDRLDKLKKLDEEHNKLPEANKRYLIGD